MVPKASLSQTAHFTAAGIAVLAPVSPGIGFRGDNAWPGPGGALGFTADHFTNIANPTVVAVFALTALSGRWPGQGWPAATAVWVMPAGLACHFLWAANHNPGGTGGWSNIELHCPVPLCCLIVWLTAAPRSRLTRLGPVIWIACPLAHAACAIAPGLADGGSSFFFFLNPAKSGRPTVAACVTGLGLLFILSGSLLAGPDRQSARPKAIRTVRA
ncbi:MAG: hypothetical protein GY717_15250 [Rhodobacteraceae bacterium]|nr:hypothetical protein [Paracoccaceae bacterium]